MTPLSHYPCLACAGLVPLSPCPCLINNIVVHAPPPPPLPPQYTYLLAIAADVCSSHWKPRPLLLSLPTLMQHCNSKPLASTTLMLSHCCMIFCHRRRPTPPLQSSTAALRHLPMPPCCRHLPMPLLCHGHLLIPFSSMLIVVC
jgi:hypothetical protein